MAEPIWGSIVGGYGRIGIDYSITNTATTTNVTVDVWFWSKYSVSDTGNTLYYDNLAEAGSATTSKGAVSVNTTVSSGSGWSATNKKKIATYTHPYTRGTTAVTRYLYAKLADIDRVGGTMYASTTFTVPKLDSYTVSYNANGGSNAPTSQTKWYGKSLTLSSAKPTRTGYTFQGWSTANDSSVEYAAGASYTGNAALTLYAVWKANTYTVSYNANGGTGAPGNQTKTYGSTLKLSSTIPTRTGYNFKGWAISASSTTASYAAGANYTANAAITLYAVWELGYTKPRIFNLSIYRCDIDDNANPIPNDSGNWIWLEFDWETDLVVTACEVSHKEITGDDSDWMTVNIAPALSGTSGTYAEIVDWGSFENDVSYDFKIKLIDNAAIDGYTEVTTTLTSLVAPIDCLPENKGIAFGKTAEFEGVAEFAYDAKFNNPVYGKALGMDRLPSIPADSDLNSYLNPGCYAVYSNAVSETCANIPVKRAGRLEVWSATGEGVRTEQWSYLRQRYIPYNESNAVWERDISRSSDNVWRYYDWWRSTLTPEASEKLYSKAAMTMCLSENKVLGAVNAYTKIPFDKVALSTNNRLTLQSNSIKIGSNIQYVKVSGQVLVSPVGSTNGLRHIRIQKTSGSTTSYIAWATIYVEAAQHTIFPITPIIASVKEGDLLGVIFYTPNADDSISSGTSTNGWQTFLTVEEL